MKKWLGPKGHWFFEVETKWGKYASILGHRTAASRCQGAPAEPAKETKDRSWGHEDLGWEVLFYDIFEAHWWKIWKCETVFFLNSTGCELQIFNVKFAGLELLQGRKSQLSCKTSVVVKGDWIFATPESAKTDRMNLPSFFATGAWDGIRGLDGSGYSLQIVCCTSSAGSCFFSSKWRGSPALWGHHFCSALTCGHF